jgi:vancomycin permeability regulator SanA
MKLLSKIKFVFYLLLLWLGVHLTYITVDGLSDNGETADVAVILGNKVNPDGTLSERLQKRLECGLNLYKTGRVKKIIVSGGLGKEGFYEGDKMKEYLARHNVPDSVIIVDNRGDNTLSTVKNTLSLRGQLHFNSIIVVSQFYHVTRTKMLFKKQGFKNVSSVSPHYFELRDAYSMLREFMAYYIN